MLMFVLGCLVGGIVGVISMCLFFVSGQCARDEERKEERRSEASDPDVHL